MSKRSPGPKWAMKQSKEKYQEERQRHRDRVARRSVSQAAEQEKTEEDA